MEKLIVSLIVLTAIPVFIIFSGIFLRLIDSSVEDIMMSESKMFRRLFFIFRKIRTDRYGNLIKNVYSECIASDIMQHVAITPSINILDLYLFIKSKYSISDYHFWVIIKSLEGQNGLKLEIDLPVPKFK